MTQAKKPKGVWRISDIMEAIENGPDKNKPSGYRGSVLYTWYRGAEACSAKNRIRSAQYANATECIADNRDLLAWALGLREGTSSKKIARFLVAEARRLKVPTMPRLVAS